ncbi:hypothetical protein EVAR_74800_1 [Eumeta japonica]|uniref:Uncharacterized protein n=1 Tax=Eumeta variegata TaxID=151549 RepID=A0A4C1SS60_EUMVA|nr:hypothetical protein EVAR_74800_1 [Eumeta japonica]
MRGTRTHARSIPVTGQRERSQRVASNIPTQEGERKKDTQRQKVGERKRGNESPIAYVIENETAIGTDSATGTTTDNRTTIRIVVERKIEKVNELILYPSGRMLVGCNLINCAQADGGDVQKQKGPFLGHFGTRAQNGVLAATYLWRRDVVAVQRAPAACASKSAVRERLARRRSVADAPLRSALTLRPITERGEVMGVMIPPPRLGICLTIVIDLESVLTKPRLCVRPSTRRLDPPLPISSSTVQRKSYTDEFRRSQNYPEQTLNLTKYRNE